jgi:hypothetical protein
MWWQWREEEDVLERTVINGILNMTEGKAI